ncbi:methyltransferase domain-containing protein [Roseococcus sp. SYP-B2431]|uniref:class I SAM-dependent methyltransferase n=1 Tax=Roseococcus sp. SYP-B2431 TaxID=2496640 RepID=UPI00103F1833|nr:class I SAM-dependent methyltransferase [Roseococcus sp. SYP-B2431]TCH99467.1 methyltransferase domain-containing protein [Roseococcus sp. SYP-B2431]
MADWSHGYVAGSTYGVAFQAAQTPAHMAMVCAAAGVDWQPRPRMTVADIGCGRGYAANTLAAANPDWTVVGLDHNPVHIAEATQTAGRAGLGNALFLEADLAALDEAGLDRIPPLDVVMVHGVWSWVSDEVREGIVRLLARRLKPGGLAYLGYNALPAAGADLALQRLLRHLAGPVGAHPGQAEAAAAMALERLRGMAGHLPLRETPMLKRLLADPPVMEPAFVAHEFLTTHWRPVFFEDLCAALGPAKLDFVGSSNLFEAVPGLVCDAPQLEAMATLPEGPPREFLKDLCLPRSFRADVFIRGGRRTDPLEALDAVVIAACAPIPEESPVLATGTGKAALPQPAWDAIAAGLAEGPQPLGALRARVAEALHPGEVLALLTGTELVLPVYRPPERAPAATRFNLAAAALHAPTGEGTGHFALASPVAAGGLPATALDLALAAALLEGADPEDPMALARRLQPGLSPEGQERAAAIIAERWDERIPVWQRFGIL